MAEQGDGTKAEDGAGAAKPPRKFYLSKAFRWAAGIFVAALAAFLTGALTGVFHSIWDNFFPTTPINVTATIEPSVFTSPVEKVQQTSTPPFARNRTRRSPTWTRSTAA